MKSSPELWAECSDAASLARHLGQFGEIRITKLEPETAVAWEGSAASGTVTLEPSGWGTRVILTVTEESSAPASTPAEPEPEPAPEPALAPEPAAEAEPEPEPPLEAAEAGEQVVVAADPPPRSGGLGRLWRLFRRRPAVEPVVAVVAPEPGPEPEPEPEPEPRLASEAAPDSARKLGPAPRSEPAPKAGVAPAGEPPAAQALAAALDSLGQAHHRPYSRS